MNTNQADKTLGDIYLIYLKAKSALASAHLMRTPSGYFANFNLTFSPAYDLEILDFIIRNESPGYNQLSRNSWILYVIEITKILSKGGSDRFSIQKFYNKLFNRELANNYDLNCFQPILALINSNNPDTVLAKLRTLRDKFYAHSDKDFNNMTDELFPTYLEAWELMDTIETFIKSMYAQKDSDVDLQVERFLFKYYMEFKRLYRYYQLSDDFGEIYRLKQVFGKERFELFKGSKISIGNY